MLEKEHSEILIGRQANLVGVSYSSLFYQPALPSQRELEIKRRIDEVYTATPFYGSRRITVTLRPEFGVSRPTIQAYMREMGIAGIAPGPNTSKPTPGHKIYPYLLRNLTASHPNHIWGIDITYIRITHGWLYLVAVLDWYSRYIMGWALSQTLEMDFVLDTVEKVLILATPDIWNSDQGSHFTSPRYLALLQNASVQISMDGRGRARDNIFTERLWRSVKYEEVYLHDYASPKEATQSLSRYIIFYNHQRPHQSLEYKTPAQVYGAGLPRIPVIHSTTKP
jgi:putative transposase